MVLGLPFLSFGGYSALTALLISDVQISANGPCDNLGATAAAGIAAFAMAACAIDPTMLEMIVAV